MLSSIGMNEWVHYLCLLQLFVLKITAVCYLKKWETSHHFTWPLIWDRPSNEPAGLVHLVVNLAHIEKTKLVWAGIRLLDREMAVRKRLGQPNPSKSGYKYFPYAYRRPVSSQNGPKIIFWPQNRPTSLFLLPPAVTGIQSGSAHSYIGPSSMTMTRPDPTNEKHGYRYCTWAYRIPIRWRTGHKKIILASNFLNNPTLPSPTVTRN